MTVYISKYNKVQELFNYKKGTFECKICGKTLKLLSGNHFKKHGITSQEYILKFGHPFPEFYEKTIILDEVISKINDLYISTRFKWKKLTQEGYYIEVNPDQPRYNKLSNYNIRNHLDTRYSIAVFSAEKSSKFLTFDVDCYGWDYHGKIAARFIVRSLENYFSRECIHVSFSGNKGYHVTVFFDNFVSIDKLKKVFNLVLNQSGVYDNFYSNLDDVIVEFRPNFNQAVKLPLGCNFKSSDKIDNYAYFVNDDFNKIDNEIEYIMNIKRASTETIREIIDTNKEKNMVKTSVKKCTSSPIIISKHIEEGIDDIKVEPKLISSLVFEGLETKQTRHLATWYISLYLKDKGYSKTESFDFLMEWSKKQKEMGFTKSNLQEIEMDITRMLEKYVYNNDKNYKLVSSRNKVINFNNTDMYLFEKINNFGQQSHKRVINHQKILFSLILHGRKHEIEGQFFMTYDQIKEISSVSSYSTIIRCLNDLEELEIIKFIQRNTRVNDGTYRNKPNVYKINFFNPDEREIISYPINQHTICTKCFFRMLRYFYSKDTLFKVVSRRLKYDILKVNENEDSCNCIM